MLSRITYYARSIPVLLSGVKNWSIVLKLLTKRGPEIVELRDGGRFQVRSLMDLWILKETCLDRDYEQASLPLQNGWTVVDIGAGSGDFSISTARRHPLCKVYAYEPFAESYALFMENMRLNHIKSVKAHPFAVSDHDGEIYLDTNSSKNAVQHSAAQGTQGVPTACKSLKSILQTIEGQKCDFLKADCEGAEFEIFLNADAATLAKIHHICMEYHDAATPHSHVELVNYFESFGFKVKVVSNPAHSDLGFLYAKNLAY